LARETGGQAFFPSDAASIPLVCREIARDLSHQYTLGYVSNRPTNAVPRARPEVFRRVTVAVPGRPGVSLRTRSGYYAAPSGPRAFAASGGHAAFAPRPAARP
jgi:hypothetical protein